MMVMMVDLRPKVKGYPVKITPLTIICLCFF
jgi:hypothetical protein